MVKDFKHIQTAHCENGVITSLLKHQGLDFMTEPLAFGMGAGLFYLHVPFLKFSGGPAISFRAMPGGIFKRTCNSLNIELDRRKFKNELKAEQFLDEKIKEGIPVGCQVGAYHLTYFPKEYRFHFNAHNLIVYGKEGDNYLISDPVMEEVTTLSSHDLNKVRFSQGMLAPKGHLYYPKKIGKIDKTTIQKAIISGINRNIIYMLKAPGPIIGVTGIKGTAKKIRTWRDKLGPRKAGLYLGQIVRMQEEIGTGGGGFRFLYAAFLEQAADHLQDDRLMPISDQFTKAGDMWRTSAVQMAGIYKGRLTEQKDFDDNADILNEISAIEKNAFQQLAKLKLK
ncbi:MAG: peptidase [Flavobacteriales bacterium]|nr:MAG: peptidase [Flavobacteriales bacterium]